MSLSTLVLAHGCTVYIYKWPICKNWHLKWSMRLLYSSSVSFHGLHTDKMTSAQKQNLKVSCTLFIGRFIDSKVIIYRPIVIMIRYSITTSNSNTHKRTSINWSYSAALTYNINACLLGHTRHFSFFTHRCRQAVRMVISDTHDLEFDLTPMSSACTTRCVCCWRNLLAWLFQNPLKAVNQLIKSIDYMLVISRSVLEILWNLVR